MYSQEAIWSAPIIKRAKYVSGRDKKSVLALSNILKILEENGEKTVTKPENVVMVRDPVLSDGYFSDVNGRCWQQSQGALVRLWWSVFCFVCWLVYLVCLVGVLVGLFI